MTVDIETLCKRTGYKYIAPISITAHQIVVAPLTKDGEELEEDGYVFDRETGKELDVNFWDVEDEIEYQVEPPEKYRPRKLKQ